MHFANQILKKPQGIRWQTDFAVILSSSVLVPPSNFQEHSHVAAPTAFREINENIPYVTSN